MAKNSNPVDSHRKAMRAKEVKKNKEARKGAREVAVVKTDTRSLENDIKLLSSKAQRAPLSASDKAELEAARTELAKITKAKTDYVEAHPESRKIVFPDRAPEASTSNIDDGRGLYLKDGKLRNPEMSYYYDPVFNPFGAPPPGMPYRRRDPTEAELLVAQQARDAFIASRLPPPPPPPVIEEDSDDEDDEDEDEIALPSGPAPISKDSDDSDSDDDDDDDIAMPAGPPPPQPGSNLPSNTARITINRPSAPSSYPYQQQQQQHQFQNHPQPFHPDPHMRFSQPNRQPQRYSNQPPPPPGLGPRNPNLPARPMATTVLDPLNTGEKSKTTYQEFQAQQRLNSNQVQVPSFPPPPPPPPSLSSASVSMSGVPKPLAGATISAAPQLRDLKAEAVAFLPSHMRKKRPNPNNAESSVSKLGKIDAAPRGEGEGGGGEKRASLMGALRGVGIGPVLPTEVKVVGSVNSGKEDYERFKREMGDFL